MTTPIFIILAALGCIEPPPSATGGSANPAVRPSPARPNPAPPAGGAPDAPGIQQATRVPEPHDGANLGSPSRSSPKNSRMA